MKDAPPTTELTADMTIGELVQTVPGSESIIRAYFYGGCHHCPAQHTEPLWLAAKLYNHDVDAILDDFRAIQRGESPSLRTFTAGSTARERRLAREAARNDRDS